MKTLLLGLLFFVTVLMSDSQANSVVYTQPVAVYQQPVVQTVMVYQTQYYTVSVPVVQQYYVQQQVIWYPYQPVVVPVNQYYVPAQPKRCRLFNY